jgi:hypothetical protein
VNNDPCALYEALKLLGVDPPFEELFGSMASLDHDPPHPRQIRDRPRLIDLAPNPPQELYEEAQREVPNFYDGEAVSPTMWTQDLQSLRRVTWQAVHEALAKYGQGPIPAHVEKARDLAVGTTYFVEGRGAIHIPPIKATKCRCRKVDKKRLEGM